MSNELFEYTVEEAEYLREGYEAAQAQLSPFATRHEDAIYEREDRESDAVRPAFVRDVDRILNNAFYNRCMDKTQVFPFYKKDDLTRRSFHLQLVSQTARKIATALRLNVPLTEAIALGHDMGHTPFGHGGEYILNDLYREHAGRCFNHNVHSVRLLRTVAGRNLSLQTLNGMLCHCGEKAFLEYRPEPCDSFEQLDAMMERCMLVPGASQDLKPSTLEGCVVRICDILAYMGKDRQDALSIGVLDDESYYVRDNILGTTNWEFIQNASANIIKNSINRDYLGMDEEVFEAIIAIKDLNNEQIYQTDAAHKTLDTYIAPMMARLYERFLHDIEVGDESSYIFRHHLNAWMLKDNVAYRAEDANAIVVDYIASMTDEYFIDLFNKLYPEDAVSKDVLYVPYFK
ncbi:MAG: HD domain-containing protein [Eggerthellaceae bacterium]|nr:HD domain-containing protein [Eggerthellaceae bacterium]